MEEKKEMTMDELVDYINSLDAESQVLIQVELPKEAVDDESL